MQTHKQIYKAPCGLFVTFEREKETSGNILNLHHSTVSVSKHRCTVMCTRKQAQQKRHHLFSGLSSPNYLQEQGYETSLMQKKVTTAILEIVGDTSTYSAAMFTVAPYTITK